MELRRLRAWMLLARAWLSFLQASGNSTIFLAAED
jgi:hypothetical protein